MNKFIKRKINIAALVFMFPSIIIMLFILVYPIINGITMSFTDRLFSYDNFSFIGFGNYVKIFNDPLFYKSLLNSLKVILYTVIFNTIIGFGLALLINSNENYIGFFRTVLFLPWVLPSTVVAFAFRWLYNDYYGYINHILLKYKIIETAVNPLASQSLVWPGILIPAVWFSYPFVMLVMTAALKSLDKSIYEAARIDGADSHQIFWKITIPSLIPTLTMLTILQIIWEISSFDLIYLLTKGGPANATLTLSLYIYKKAFENKQLGYACALSTVMFMLLAVFIIIYFTFSKNGDKNEN